MTIARVADLVARINNGYRAKLRQIYVQNSKANRGILHQLFKEGYITEYRLAVPDEEEKAKLSPREQNKPLEHNDIAVTLKYRDYRPVVSEIKVVSKPGKKKYVSFQELTGYRVQGGLGCYILSTSWGIMTDKEALRKRTGGEVLVSVY